jgi:hypothetical protein
VGTLPRRIAPHRASPAGPGRGWARRRARRLAALLVAVLAGVLAGCGSGDDDSTSASQERPPGVEFAAAKGVGLGVSRAKLVKQIGEPVLRSEPTKYSTAAGGCLFFPMRDRPLSDVFTFCLDEHDKVVAAVTQYADEPDPPPDASVARTVLIARGDVICDVNVVKTGDPAELERVLKGPSPSPVAERGKAAAMMRKFADGLRRDRAEIGAFNAPDDARSELTAYLDALDAQAAALDRAASALASGKGTYPELRRRVTDLGAEAADHAQAYGFTRCPKRTVS